MRGFEPHSWHLFFPLIVAVKSESAARLSTRLSDGRLMLVLLELSHGQLFALALHFRLLEDLLV